MKKLIPLSLALACSLFSTGAFAGQANLRSAEGLQITVYYDVVYHNYSSNKPNEVWDFSDVRIEVKGGLRPTDRVQAVFVNKLRDTGYCGIRGDGDYQEVYRKDLETGDVGTFQGDMTRNVYVRNRMNGDYMLAQSLVIHQAIRAYCRNLENLGQEVAVVVNGRWLTDPVSGLHNFKVNLR